MPSDFQLVSKPAVAPVSAHAWNKDRTQLAISPSNNEVLIYEFKNGNFTLLHTLSEHTQNVTSIDWAPESNRIVTCGQDRNAYVFKLEDNVWKPTLVILRINRAATYVRWNAKEDKFALGSGSRLLSVCYFDPEFDWWASKHIKKPVRSTVTCADWHPNGVVVACGGSDFKVRIFSGFIKQTDEKPEDTVWGKKLPFGELYGEFGTGPSGGGWIHSVSFSPSGEQLAFAAHDSSVTVIDGKQASKVFRCVTNLLPQRCLLWVTPKSVVAGGYDYVPVLFTFDGSAVTLQGKLDVPEKKAKGPSSAMDKFKNLDKKGTADEDSTNTSVDSVHQNAIIETSIFEGAKGSVKKFSTTGVDGKVVIWDIAEIKSQTGIAIP